MPEPDYLHKKWPEPSTVNFMPEPDPPFWTKTAWLQLGYGVWVNLTLISVGMALGFPAVTIPQLLEPDSPIELTPKSEALIASVITLTAPIGSLISGILIDKCGRKAVLVICEVPMLVGWLYVGFAKSARDIIIGRVICGLSMGMMMSAPRTYITEITLPNMRGVVGALPNLATSIGLSLQAGLGSYLKWYILCYIGAANSLVLGISKMFLPDSPYYILLRANANAARSTLKRFRSSKFNIDAEINELDDYKTVNNIRSLTFKEHVKALFSASGCKPFGIIAGYLVIMQMSGVNVVTGWAVQMLELSKSSVNPNLGNFLMGITRIVFSILASILLYRVGRRPLAFISALGLGVVCLCFGGFLHSDPGYTVYPALFFMGYIAFAALGYYTLPFLMMFELLPLQVRGVLSAVAITIVNLVMFVMNQVYPTMRKHLGLANTIIFYGMTSLLGSIFLYFLLPETKDLTLQEIEEYFNSIRPTLVSQRTVMSMQLFSEMSKPGMKSNASLQSALDLARKKKTDKTKSTVAFRDIDEDDEDSDKDRDKSKGKGKDKDGENSKDKRKDKDRDKDRDKDKDKDRDKEKDKDRDNERGKDRDKDKDKDRDKSKDNDRDKDKDRDNDRGKDRDNDRKKNEDNDRDKNRDRDKDRDRDRDKDGGENKNKDRDKNIGNTDTDRHKDKNRESDTDKVEDENKNNQMNEIENADLDFTVLLSNHIHHFLRRKNIYALSFDVLSDIV